MTAPKVKPTRIKAKITIPGIGQVTVGPEEVPMEKGEKSSEKIIKRFKEAQKEGYLSPIPHVFAE